MTDVKVANAIGRFFFLIHLDETAARESATLALNEWRNRIQKVANPAELARPILVQVLTEYFVRFKHVPQSGQPVVFSADDWIIPTDVDLGPWLEFRKVAEPDELLAVLLLKILNQPEETVSLGMNVSVGTLRHRLSRGLKRLGQIQLSSASGHSRE